MKPRDWQKMSEEEKRRLAAELVSSARGRFIMAQALYVASSAMSDAPAQKRETSNIEDMQMILESLFPEFDALFRMRGGI